MKALPGEFLSRMQAELKGDYAAFLESYNNESVRGLRANTLKGNADAIAALCPVKLEGWIIRRTVSALWKHGKEWV